MLNFQKLLFSFCAVCILFFSASGQNKTASVGDWRLDVDEIVKDIRLLHPDLFTKTGKHAFMREVRVLKEAIPSLSQEQRVVRTMQLVASLGDGQTMIEPDNPAFADWYPVRIYEFTDGYFVTSAHKSVADLAGAQLLEIAGLPVSNVMANARTLFGADNMSVTKERLWAFHNAGLMKGLDYAAPNGELKVKLKLRDGTTVDRTLTPTKTNHKGFKADDATFEWQYRAEIYGLPIGTDEEWISGYKNLPATAFQTSDMTRPPHLTDRLPYVARPLPEQDAFYIRTNFINDTDFVPFFQGAMKEVDKQKPRRLILDWRYNVGGDTSKMYLMLHEFIKRTDDKPWKELYILTGRKTLSAVLDAFLENIPVSIVGEPNSTGFNHYSDPAPKTYSRTGLRLNVSTKRYQLSDSEDLTEFVAVDVPAPFSFADYAAGRDPAVDPILRGEDMRGIPVIARLDGSTAARKIYEDRKTRFAKYDWWSPPKEFDLRQACDALLAEKRTSEAVETCKLNAEIHPYIWNVWYNLATAQRAAGLKNERLASYRCMLELAPDNWNAPAIRRFLAQPGNEGNEFAPGCPAKKPKSDVADKTVVSSVGGASKDFKPAVVRYGATVAETEAALAGRCKKITVRQINQPFLVLREIVKDKQMQIDCDGFEYFGKPRWAEFIFADDSLEMVWILTEAGDEAALLKAMTDASGELTHRNDKFIAATKGRAALRTDKPEVLFYSEKLAPRVLGWFDKNSTFR